jgi:GT2 family glycosyltransferase
VFGEVGGWSGELWLIHEGVDLAWRVLEAGYRVRYEADLVALHPLPVPGAVRHHYSLYYAARNRVWLARRNLPLPFVPIYVASWTAIQILRWSRNRSALRAWFAGWWEGWRGDCGERRPLTARTIWRMTLAGRPPVV